MSVIRQITARQLSVTALTIWCCSLAFTGIVLYSGQKHLPGFEILAMGWLSPLVLNFAWFANIFFLYGIFRLLSGGVPIKSAILATLLSLDTFRFSQYLLNEGGATSPVYGYGWGAVLWFVSIFLMLAAVGTRRRETNTFNKPSDMQEWLQPLGFVLLSITLGTASYFAIHDRMVANPAEAQRLANIAFKRGKVCGAPEPVATNPIRNLSGPIELVIEKNALYANYPFAQIKDLLEWGIPTVRIGNTDYSYESTARNRSLSSTPAAGAPAAILYVNETYLRTISAKLVETSTNRTVFEQTWERENHPVNTNYYCPDYHSFPSLNEQPRQLLMQALNIQATNATTKEIAQETRVFDRIEGNIIGRNDGGNTRAMRIARWKEMNPDSKTSVPYHEIFNTNCPSDIGWDGSNYESRQNTGWPFMVKGKAYYLRHRDRYNATCEGEFAYIYAGTARDGKYYLNIEKRDLRDFRQAWARIVVISDVSPSTREDVLKVQSIKKVTDAVTIELVNEDSGQVLFVQAPLHDKRVY
jgi:hypothetical protein